MQCRGAIEPLVEVVQQFYLDYKPNSMLQLARLKGRKLSVVVGVAERFKAPGCGPGDRGFESLRSPFLISNSYYELAPVAQRIRASVFGTEGRGFESPRARHF